MKKQRYLVKFGDEFLYQTGGFNNRDRYYYTPKKEVAVLFYDKEDAEVMANRIGGVVVEYDI